MLIDHLDLRAEVFDELAAFKDANSLVNRNSTLHYRCIGRCGENTSTANAAIHRRSEIGRNYFNSCFEAAIAQGADSGLGHQCIADDIYGYAR